MADYKTIYEPDNSLKKGYPCILHGIMIEFVRNRWLIYQLFRRDFLSAYKQSFIGIFWAILIPFVSVGTFMVLNRAGIFQSGSLNVPYPVYAIFGIAFWQLFSTGLIAGSNSLVKAGNMLIKINFSKKSLVLAATLQGMVSFIIQFLLGIFVCFYCGVTPHWQIFLLPIILLPLILLTFGISLILALLNGIMRDIENIITILLTFMMFLTPILYMKPQHGILALVTNINPLYYLISAPRDCILHGIIYEWNGFVLSSFLAVFIFILCLLAFHLTETRVAERV